MNLSLSWYKYGDYSESDKISKFILEQFGLDNYKLYYRMGITYSAQKRFEDAIDAFEKASFCVAKDSAEGIEVAGLLVKARQSKKALDEKKRAQFNLLFSK